MTAKRKQGELESEVLGCLWDRPAGLASQQILALLGDDSIKNLPRGDLMVVMSVLDSDGYTRKGNDLYTDKTIDCFQAVRGYEFNLRTLEDKIIKVKVPSGTQPNTILQVKGQGMPVHKTIGIRGNLYVKIHILIPQLSAADLKKIKDL